MKLIFGNFRNFKICEIWGHFEAFWVIFKILKYFLIIVEKIEIFVDFLIKFAIFRQIFNFSKYFLIN